MQDAYVLVGKNLEIIRLNNAAQRNICNMLKKNAAPGTSILELAPEERHPFLKSLYKAVLSGEVKKTETAIAGENGEKIFYENVFMPARRPDGEIVAVLVHSTDITEKKISDLTIQAAEERWQFALDAADQGAWDWNMQTNEVIYSSSYKNLYGFSDDELRNDLCEWQSRIHPEDKKRIDQDVMDHVNSNNPYYETTYRIRLKNNEYKWIMARGKLLSRDEQGNPLRMIGTHTDLTKSMQVEEEIREMNERFVYAAKASAQALWEWNAMTGHAYVSTSFTELFGWEPDQNRYFEQWRNYIHPDDAQQTVDSYFRQLDDPDATIWQAEYRFLKADGSYAVVNDRAYIIRGENGEVIKVIGATQDITAKKRTEEELYKSNERFDIMLKATNELLWEWDVQSNSFFRAKEGLRKVYGVTENASIETIELWLQRVHPEDNKKVKDILCAALKGSNHQTFELEYRFRKDDGSYAFIYDRGILLTDEKNQPLRMIGAAQDISERKRLENELLQNELEYKKLINQATVDSQEQERGEIGKELHDNVNQVLTTSKLYLELALANEEMRKELIKKSSKNISSVINEIRLLSRSLMDPSLGDLGIVDSIKDLTENINFTRKIHIAVEIEDEIEDLLDTKQKLTIFRIIQESLNNIIRHAKAKNVAIQINHRSGIVNLVIVDDGIGFLQDSIKKGAGLKNITNRVYLINGSLFIQSLPGEGCAVKINFPISKLVTPK